MGETELLLHVYQTAEMGRDGIRSVLAYSNEPAMTQALRRQEREYRLLQEEAAQLLRERQVEPESIGVVAKVSAEVMSGIKTMLDHSATKLAELMIQGSTMGVTKSLRTLRDCQFRDESVRALGERLLQTEQANIEEMKKFL